jgi:molybdopterin biosynthesis enzyme MoaB
VILWQKEFMRIGILTISDRASQGVYEDQSGPALREMIEKHFGEDVDLTHIVPTISARSKAH